MIPDDMPPMDRDLDLTVYKGVFGKQPSSRWISYQKDLDIIKDQDPNALTKEKMRCVDPSIDWEVPKYSQYIEASWGVVDALKMHEPEISWNDELASWVVSFNKQPGDVVGSHKYISRAICLAAAALTGGKE